MRKYDRGGFMVGDIPKISSEPSVVRIYRGCSIYTYSDRDNRTRFVMANEDGTIKHGTYEASQFLCIEEMGESFKLEFVTTV